MRNIDKNSLMEINKESIFHKIKMFFVKLFNKNKDLYSEQLNNMPDNNLDLTNNTKNNQFMESIKNNNDDEIEIIELQKLYRRGEISEEQLTKRQIELLSELYDKQISELEKSNERRKEKLLIYRNKMQNSTS